MNVFWGFATQTALRHPYIDLCEITNCPHIMWYRWIWRNFTSLFLYVIWRFWGTNNSCFCPCFLNHLPSFATSSLLQLLHSCLTAALGGPVSSVLMSGVAWRSWSRAQRNLLVHLMGSIGDLYSLKGSFFISSMRCKCEWPFQPQACAHQGFKLSFPL